MDKGTLHTFSIFYYKCRYSITADIGDGHLVLGRKFSFSHLKEDDISAVLSIYPTADLLGCIVYQRLLISGVLYTSAAYSRSQIKCDYLLCVIKGSSKKHSLSTKISQLLLEGVLQLSIVLPPCYSGQPTKNLPGYSHTTYS